MTISFFIPGQAVPQLRPRIIKKGNHMGLKDPDKVKDYKAFVRLVAAERIKGKDNGGFFPTRDPIILNLRFLFPVPKSWSKRKQQEAEAGRLKHTTKPDVDNLTKAIKDALTGLIWHDDSQIVLLFAKKEYAATGEEGAGVYVRISVID